MTEIPSKSRSRGLLGSALRMVLIGPPFGLLFVNLVALPVITGIAPTAHFFTGFLIGLPFAYVLGAIPAAITGFVAGGILPSSSNVVQKLAALTALGAVVSFLFSAAFTYNDLFDLNTGKLSIRNVIAQAWMFGGAGAVATLFGAALLNRRIAEST